MSAIVATFSTYFDTISHRDGQDINFNNEIIQIFAMNFMIFFIFSSSRKPVNRGLWNEFFWNDKEYAISPEQCKKKMSAWKLDFRCIGNKQYTRTQLRPVSESREWKRVQELAALTIKYAMRGGKTTSAAATDWKSLHREKQNKISIIYSRNGCDLCTKHLHMWANVSVCVCFEAWNPFGADWMTIKSELYVFLSYRLNVSIYWCALVFAFRVKHSKA